MCQMSRIYHELCLWTRGSMKENYFRAVPSGKSAEPPNPAADVNTDSNFGS